jgi:hypothetical protein
VNRPDGYRYVWSYHVKLKDPEPYWNRWALYEVIDGRARRVGTAKLDADYRTWLNGGSLT